MHYCSCKTYSVCVQTKFNECHEASLDYEKLPSVAAYKPFIMTEPHPLLMKRHDHTRHKPGWISSRDTYIEACYTVLQNICTANMHLFSTSVFLKLQSMISFGVYENDDNDDDDDNDNNTNDNDNNSKKWWRGYYTIYIYMYMILRCFSLIIPIMFIKRCLKILYDRQTSLYHNADDALAK